MENLDFEESATYFLTGHQKVYHKQEYSKIYKNIFHRFHYFVL